MGFSNVGFLTSTLRYLDNNQKLFELADARLATGKKYQRIQDYGRFGNRVVDLRALVSEIGSYKGSIKQVKVTVDAYDQSLASLSDLASQISRWSADVPASGENQIWATNTKAFIRGALLGIQEELNLEVSGRYIFGGANINRPPVRTLTELPLMGARDSYNHTTGDKSDRFRNEIETGDNPNAVGRIPQYKYYGQDLAVIKNLQDYHEQPGTSGSYRIDTEAFTLGSGETLDYRVTLPGGARLPNWITYDKAQKKLDVNIPAGATAPVSIQVEATNGKGETLRQTFRIVPTTDPIAIPEVKDQASGLKYTSGQAFDEVAFRSEVGGTGTGPLAVTLTTAGGGAVPAGVTAVIDATTGNVNVRATAAATAAFTGDQEFVVTVRDNAGNERQQRVTLIDKFPKEFEYGSYLSDWNSGPVQPGGLPLPPQEPISINKGLWKKPTVSIAKTLTIDYGLTAAAPAFQKLIDAAIRLKSATQDGLTFDERAAFIRSAKELAEEARQGLTSLSSENTSTSNVFTQRDKLHTMYRNIAQGELDDIVGISAEKATAELVNIQSMITSSYALIAKRQEMSLAKYL
jgi:flagellin-like hook-associated protein FlgL